MKMLIYAVSLSTALALIGACAHAPVSTPLRIDSSTVETFQSSWDRLRSSLTPRQQSQLDVAILPIAMGKYKSFTDVPPSLLTGVGPQNIRAEINGMTYGEIIDLANKQPVKVQLPR